MFRDGPKMRLGRETGVSREVPGDGAPAAPRRHGVGPAAGGASSGGGAAGSVGCAGRAADARQGRSTARKAFIGDGRNDENLVVAQLHTAMLRFHNAVVDALPAGPDRERFLAARQFVRHVHQWLVLHDYLPTICDQQVLKDVLDAGRAALHPVPPGAGWPNSARRDALAAGVLGRRLPLRALDDPRRLRLQPQLREGGQDRGQRHPGAAVPVHGEVAQPVLRRPDAAQQLDHRVVALRPARR
ncbi:peroxidase family protein [Caulobacter segnis]